MRRIEGELQRRQYGDFRDNGVAVIDWNLSPTDTGKYEANPDALDAAKRLGFDGVQVSIGKVSRGPMPLSSASLQQEFVDRSAQTGVVISSLRLNQWENDNPVSEDRNTRRRARAALDAAMPIAQELGARPDSPKVLLLPFFGPNEIRTSDQMNRAASMLKSTANEAADIGVILGIENTITVAANLELINRAEGSPVLGVYGDIGNEHKFGRDPAQVLDQLLQEGRLAEVHLKDSAVSYLDPTTGKTAYKMEPRYLNPASGTYPGRINVPDALDVLIEGGFTGNVILETNSPREVRDFTVSKDDRDAQYTDIVEEDLQTNLSYIRHELFVARAKAA